MAKATKTWKIGEYCKGGVITVEISGKEINIIGKEWDFSTGSRKSSNQSNAKEWTRLTINLSATYLSADASNKCEWFLFDLTTSYWTDEIMNWIKTKLQFEKNAW
jgi:hypothetical protein